MTTYAQMEAEIAAVPKFGAQPHPDLNHLNEYLKLMNHPEEGLRVIHVAGTNGKGSVCAFIESVLRHAGYRTGLFTSPHLIRMNERFRINFQPVENELMIRAWTEVREVIKKGEERSLAPLTWFEIMFLMGMWIFSRSKIDYCVVETGLGGRLDATAVLRPLVSVITSISLDHEDILGHTIEEIAREKAGIIKEGVPAVALDEKNGAFEVLLKESLQKHVHIEKVSCDKVTILKKRKNKIDFSINTSYYRYGTLTIKTCADYQVYNAALAVRTLEMILPEPDPEAVRTGLSDMRWAGRMEEIRPDVFLDGAHNPGAIARICETLPSLQEKHWVLLFAVCSDKDYTDMIRQLSAVPFRRIYVTRSEGSGGRGASPDQVERCFRQFCTETELICLMDAKEAFLRALHDKRNDERLLCIGSLYLVGEIRSLCDRLPESEREDTR